MHPDDSFSTVPYEKGHTLLYYLETLLGADSLDAFLKAYVERFKYKSIVTDDWKSFLYEFFANKKDILDKVSTRRQSLLDSKRSTQVHNFPFSNLFKFKSVYYDHNIVVNFVHVACSIFYRVLVIVLKNGGIYET